MNRSSKSLPRLHSLLAGAIALSLVYPAAAADIGDFSRDIRSAKRATRDGKYVLDQAQSITKVVTVKRKDSLPTDNDNVILYSSARCEGCDEARQYLETNGIAFKEYDVRRSAQGRSDYEELGSPGVPIVLVGTQRMNGWSDSRFKRLYAKFQEAEDIDAAQSPLGVGAVLTAKIDNIPLFESNSRDSNVVARLQKGEEVVAMSELSGELIEVQSSTGSGWVDARMIQASDE